MRDKIKTRALCGAIPRSGSRSLRRGHTFSVDRTSVLSFSIAVILSFAISSVFPSSAQPTTASGAFAPAAWAGTPDSHGAASLTPQADAAPRNAQPTSVTLIDGNTPPRAWITVAGTVGDALDDTNICLGPHDIVTPARNQPITPGLAISIKRVRFEIRTETCPIPFKTVFKMSASVQAGQITKGHHGKPGLLKKIFEAKFVNDRCVGRRLIAKTVARKPVNEETLAGIRVRMARALPSRSGLYRRMRCYDMVATGYSPYEGSCTGRCATGMRAGYGVVAVDPRVIRLGTTLYVEGYGYAVAGDTGGAIKGHRIDLGHTTYSEAYHVGRRKVKVWVISQTE